MTCWWIFGHRWSPWTDYLITFQERHCVKCGKRQTRDPIW